MSAIVAIAYGLVELKDVDPKRFKLLRKAVREELRQYRIRLLAIGGGGGYANDLYRLERRHKAKDRRNSSAIFTKPMPLAEACRKAMTYITPSDQGTP